jgi:hypothetical protein
MSANERMIGRIEELTTKQRRTLRTRARAQRRVAMGVRLCGAKTRSGRPCIAKGTGRGGRCKNHGGASTWAKTPEGRAKCLAGLKRANDRRAAEARRRGERRPRS